MNDQALAAEILRLVGNKENIKSVTHCFTRLRLNLVNEGLADTPAIEKLSGVIKVISQAGQYQIVIGNQVAGVYQKLIAILGTNFDQSASDTSEQGSKNPLVRMLESVASIFAPVIVAITGAGMLKALMALFLATGIISPEMSTYQVLAFIADSAFYYLPFLLAVSAARKLNCNMYIAMAIAGVLLHPNFLGMMEAGPISFLGLPVTNANYSSSVIPILLAIWLMSYVESFVDRISPDSIKFMTKPLLTLLIVAPITLLILGPLGAIAGNQLAAGLSAINASSFGWLVPFIVGGLAPVLVMTGMHYALIPIGLQNLASLKYDSVVGPGNMVSNISQGAACLAVAVRAKNPTLRKLAISNSISALCGITEPALYGVTLQLKRPFLAVIIGGAAGGLFAGLTGVARFAAGVPGLISLPGYINPDGTFDILIYAIIANIIAFGVTFIFTLIFGFEDDPAIEEVEASVEGQTSTATVEVTAPISGKTMTLSNMNDPAFSEGALGKGIAIEPTATDGTIVAPVDGILTVVSDTKHALGFTTETGVEVLVHVGIDTVELKGEHFDIQAKVGDKVKAGDILGHVDIKALKQKGYDVTTAVVVVNTPDVLVASEKEARRNAVILTVHP